MSRSQETPPAENGHRGALRFRDPFRDPFAGDKSRIFLCRDRIQKTGGRSQSGMSAIDEQAARLTFGELEALTRLFVSVLLAFLHPAVTRQVVAAAEHFVEFGPHDL